MPNAQKIILLTGAPKSQALSWDDDTLINGFAFPITRFLGLIPRIAHTDEIASRSQASPAIASWRKPVFENDEKFLNGPRRSQRNRKSGVRQDSTIDNQQFLEYSFAVFYESDSANIIAPNRVEDRIETSTLISFDGTTEMSITNSDASVSFESPAAPNNTSSLVSKVTDLKALPSAQHIQRIHPSTITVDLLVGIINISPPRTVRLRKRVGEMDIVEMLVGDETSAGFPISFWLLPENSGQVVPDDDPRGILKTVRSGNIILIRNVALSVFGGRVYGQSLSRRVARNSTKITKMCHSNGMRGIAPVDADKLARAEKWRDNFLGVPVAATRRKGAKRMHSPAALPPDTQD